MIIKRIELTNWGPHRSLKADLTANVVGVIGGNGKGKSNFLQAIDYGLNGNLNKQNKELYIYNFGKEDGATKATVKIEFSKNGKDGEITRTITKSSSSRCLKWDGKEYKSDAEVSKQMELILGADKAAMANAVFIKQGCLAALVKGTPAERMAIFQKLMNLAFLDSRYNDIHNRIERLKSGITDYRPALDFVASQLAATRENITKLKESEEEDPSEDLSMAKLILSILDEIKSSSDEVTLARGKLLIAKGQLGDMLRAVGYATEEQYKKAIEAYSEQLNAIALIDTLNDRRDSTSRWLLQNKAAISSMTAKLETVKASVLDADTKSEYQLVYKEADNKIKKCAARDALKIALSSAEESLRNSIAKAEEISTAYSRKQQDNNTQAWERIIREQTARITTLNLRKAYLESSLSEDTCPVCGNHMTPVADPALRASWIKEVRSSLDSAIAFRSKAEKRLQEAQKELHDLSIQNAVCERQVIADTLSVENLTKQIEALVATEENIEQIKQVRDKMLSALRAHEDALWEMQDLTEEIEQKQKENISLKNDLEKIIAKINEQAALIHDERHDIETLLSSLKAEEANITTASKAVTSAESALNVRIEAASNARNKLIREDIECAMERLGIQDIGIDTDYTVTLTRIIEDLEAKADAYREAKATMTSLQTAMRQLIQNRQELLEKAEAESARMQLIEDLEMVGRMTNKNGLPLAYMNSVFDHITDMVQEMLSRMGANFTVIKDDERPCTFRFIRTDDNTGYSMPQEMLSGGQAIRLSLALLIACQQLILPDVGLLVLDEPSSHMDAEGVDSLKELFLQMTSIFHSSETQLITVDHNPTLVAALEKVIQL